MASEKGPISLIDPSQLLRPEPMFNDKPIDAFRDYSIDQNDPIKDRVRRTYYAMHTNVTVDFVKQKREKWLKFNHFKANIKEALIKLNDLVDESDPDTDLPNIVHAFQTAERIREDHPDDDWFHLTGLIHDSGKVMAFYDEPQWCVVGDTFAVGCKWTDSIVYGQDSFKDNPDSHNPKYNTKYGMYKPHCGLDNLLISWSHDEYLYQFLKHNKAKLPEKALYMIRYHSFYPWHAGGDYRHLTNERDEEVLKWVLEFNKYDLYTKSEKVPDIEALWPYYEGLIAKYIPGVCECTKYGIYQPNCGLENLMMSWGHDEYLYRVMLHNNAKFPKEALWMIRYHSFYPWHAGGDYKHLLKEGDEEIMKHVQSFNKFDLYTKSAPIPDVESLWPYYQSLIDKYLPGIIEF